MAIHKIKDGFLKEEKLKNKDKNETILHYYILIILIKLTKK